ncbi:zinc metallopeptidase [Geosporobacter ferrireducens]|uniref:Peptidase n=1 Tax=Geosporobacter ferrireducens TaxID=1424294 RepID=A0A1D8GBZ4_9FIRM|nr:zinc metallopeptidase [Geosporobacter ferrireducens]AOT68416.1 peptidase [Geosporobacter ferrireducens]MTI53869.1 zinc metallopeptidase [Geosporobacter ferrireducens]
MGLFYSPYGGFGPGMMFLLPAIILAMYAQAKVRNTFQKYLKVSNQKGYTGAQVARAILDRNGLRDVEVEHVGGYLSDHYDPRVKVLRLSPQVFSGTSIASISVAAHEAGHAIQHGVGYIPLTMRNTIAPIASFGSQAVWMLVFGGFILGWTGLIDLGILLYMAAVAFQIITLPVEFNASSRAIEQLEIGGFISTEEIRPSKKVLDAAALTYVAAMAVSVAQLLRLLVLRNRRD